MVWLALCLPLMIVGIAIATVPLIHAFHHQHRYGLEMKPRSEPPRNTQRSVGTTVCPDCAAVVVDQKTHTEAVHQPALA
jgi:hypothetical protein